MSLSKAIIDEEEQTLLAEWFESENLTPEPSPPVEPKRSRARKTIKYHHGIAMKICEQIMVGARLKDLCARPDYPSLTVVLRWLADPTKVEFANAYRNAKRVYVELLVEDVIAIADDDSGDYVTKTDRKGNKYDSFNPENVHRSKLRIETRMKIAEKVAPKIYGNHKHTHLELPEELRQMLAEAKNRDKGLPPKPVNTFDNTTGNPIDD